MSIVVNVNGESINYPQTGDTNWGDEATDFAVQTSSALAKVGLSTGTTVDLPGTLDVTGNTTLDANLSVGGTTSLTGNVTLTNNLTVNGNTQLGNANTDTIGVTGIVNVDAGTLYVDPTNNRVGINKTSPAKALDVTGDVAISGNETVGGTLGVTGDVAINTNKFNITASSGNTTIAGTLGISNGTALAPAITPSGDTNTGLYSIGEDKFGFSANGVRQGEFGVGYGGFTGNIIQSVSSQTTTQVLNTSNSTWIDSNLSCSITPKYNNSKIIIILSQSYYMAGANNGAMRILRDSNVIYTNGYACIYNNLTIVPIVYMDTISSIATYVYKTQFKIQTGGSGSFYMNFSDASGSQTSNMVLLEVQV